MKQKKLFLMAAMVLTATMTFAQSKVYFTKEITPESLVKIYKALGVEPQGRVAVKISTGEGGNTHYLKPTFIRNLVNEVNGTIVECCTAYGGTRQDPKKHWETIHDHGFDSIFAVDIMDEFHDIRIPMPPSVWLLLLARRISTQLVRPTMRNWLGDPNIWLPARHRTTFWSRWLLLHRLFITISVARLSISM